MFSRKKTKITMKIRDEGETLVWPHGGNVWSGSVVIIIIIIKDISYSPGVERQAEVTDCSS